MKITKIEWLSQEALEAEVAVTDGTFEVICFAHPLHYQVGSELIEPIYCYDTTNVVKSVDNEYNIEKLAEYFAYHITGKLVDKQNGLVMVGQVLLEVDSNMLPGDIREEDFISFSCKRLDVI